MSQSQVAPVVKTLGEAEGKVVQHLVGGDASSTAAAMMEIQSVEEAVLKIFLGRINAECSTLCKKHSDSRSQFRNVPVTKLAEFTWGALVTELEAKAPTLFELLTTIVSFSDHRNKDKTGSRHHPGICVAVAMLLKERNREMCTVQSIVSILMYLCQQ